MTRHSEQVDNLKKVSLGIEAWTNRDGEENAYTEDVTIIFGIGSGGLSPLEMQLQGRRTGDVLKGRVLRPQWVEFFGRPLPAVLTDSNANEEIVFRIRVKGVEPAEQREVVKAMAEAAECSSGCCSHH